MVKEEKVLLSLEKAIKEDGFSKEKIESINNKVFDRVNFKKMGKEIKFVSIDDACDKMDKLIADADICVGAKGALKYAAAKCIMDEFSSLFKCVTVFIEELKGMSAPEAKARAKELVAA